MVGSRILILALSGNAIATATSPSDRHQAIISSCCQDLEHNAGLNGKVYMPNSEAYEARLGSYWSRSAALQSWCLVQPSTAKDVSAIIKSLVAGDCPFGVRGGGHGSFALSNAVKDGVTIDFGNMNATTWDANSRLASIPPGTSWQTVYETLAPHGVVVTGGRAGTVGTAGFLTGGGNSFHSASHGMGCDTVANFEVVLANGDIVNANATSNPDLWRGLKGGSGNLGLVTRFDMYPIEFANPQKPVVWGGNIFYNLKSGPAVIDALVDFTENVHKDENSSAIVYWAYLPQAVGGTIINAALYNTVAEPKAAAFDGFYAVPGIYEDTTRVDKLSTLIKELGEGQPAGSHNIWLSASFKNDPRPINYAVNKFSGLNAALEQIAPSSSSDLYTLCLIQPITKSIVEKGIANGGNVMGLDKYILDGNGQMFLVTVAFNSAETEKLALPLIAAYVKDIDDYAESLGLKWNWRYLNYSHSSQDVMASLGKAALAKLREAAAKYDPTGVFQKLRASGFKIPVESEWAEL